MKTLYMVRHAKSSWKHNLEDHQRPLKERGIRDGKLVANELKNNIQPPQKIISSDAVRARTTAHFFKDAFALKDEDFTTKHELYDFGGNNVMNFIKSLDNTLDTVMIVGHNHAFTSIVNMLGDSYIDNLPTAGFVAIQFNEDSWSTLTMGKTIKILFPRNLK